MPLILTPLILLELYMFFSSLISYVADFSLRFFKRAEELLADNGAAEITQDPKSMGFALSEMDFHFLRWGIIRSYLHSHLYEPILNSTMQSKCKRFHHQMVKKNKNSNSAEKYHNQHLRFVNENKKNCKTKFPSILWLKETYSNAVLNEKFSTHPSNSTRMNTLREAFPGAFKMKPRKSL